MKRWLKNLMEVPQNMMEIGPTAMIDLNEVSAVYKESLELVIRIGGMGVIKLSSRQLHQSVDYTYNAIAERLIK
jgi:hypothetical protein